jgi:DNA repair photolyase
MADPFSVHPLFFDPKSSPDAAVRPPTTREIARAVKAGEASALTEAEARADDARYVEVTCRSALNRVEGMPFRWTLNPYRGCTHACHYCFARRYHTQFELGSGDDFATVIFVKHNIVSVLTRELARPGWGREQVALGTATDPYQPIEGQYRLTRRSLEALAAARTPVGLVTKGPMVVRDKDVLVELARKAGCSVCMSVPTVDEDAWRVLEPGTAHPLQRLRAVRELVEAGVEAGVLMAPIVPGFSSAPAKLERTVKAAADHGAKFLGCNVMYLQDGTREHFMRFVEEQFPAMRDRFERLYAGKYPPAEYRRRIAATMSVLRGRHGFDTQRREGAARRPNKDDGADRAAGSQAAFDWNSEPAG